MSQNLTTFIIRPDKQKQNRMAISREYFEWAEIDLDFLKKYKGDET